MAMATAPIYWNSPSEPVRLHSGWLMVSMADWDCVDVDVDVDCVD